jgi:hypothetical protein
MSYLQRSWNVALLVLAVLSIAVGQAHAQAATCARLQQSLAQLDSSGAFRNSGGADANARNLAQAVQQAESMYIRTGCNDAARAGQQLTRECQQIGRDVLRLRGEYAAASEAVQSAGSVARQREAVLQELARFGCNAGGGNANTDRGNFLEQIFGRNTDPNFSDGQVIENFGAWQTGGSTVRTLCVRLSDGYFWPVSYSTTTQYLEQDFMSCQQMCPGEAVDLYYHANPGEEAEQMRNMAGQPYTLLPTAFSYRQTFNPDAACRTTAQNGAIASVTSEDGSGRTMVTYNGATFPMPMRNPRRNGQLPVAVAELEASNFVSDIPLPRRRPAGPGEAPLAQAVAAPAESEGLRLVQFGDRVVRVVGPNTPYAQSGAAGS